MVEFVTRAQLRHFASELQLEESAALRHRASAQPSSGSTFLSHSSKDYDLVIGATRVLENHGARVYVDEIDPEMPPYTSEQTAQVLKSRIRQTSRFVLLTSENSKTSRWVPWELGIADGYKGLKHIALFPSADAPNDTSWASWEYLGLYQRIVWGRISGTQEDTWLVHDHRKNTAVTLRNWLKLQ